MRTKSVVVGHLGGNLDGERGIDAAVLQPFGKLFQLVVRVFLQRDTLTLQIGGFHIGLRRDRDILPRGHGQRTSGQSGETGQGDISGRHPRRGNADQKARDGNNPVIRPQYSGAQPVAPVDVMAFFGHCPSPCDHIRYSAATAGLFPCPR